MTKLLECSFMYIYECNFPVISLNHIQSSESPEDMRPSPGPLQHGTNQLETYQNSLEEVLTWLLSAEDGLQGQPPISSSVEEVKEQFHTYEVKNVVYFWKNKIKWQNLTCRHQFVHRSVGRIFFGFYLK